MIFCMPRIYLFAALMFTAPCVPAAEQWKPGSKPRAIPAGMFVTDPALEVTLWATTPQLFNPTNMDIDHAGRVWVTEGVNYRGNNGRRKAGDRVGVLQDTNGDGRCDQSHTFVQEEGFIAPLGLAVFEDDDLGAMCISFCDPDQEDCTPSTDARRWKPSVTDTRQSGLVLANEP